MGAIVSVAELRKALVSSERILALHRKLTSILAPLGGLQSCTAWQSQSDVDDYLVVVEYSDAVAGDRGLEAILSSEFFLEVATTFDEPMDLHRSIVVWEQGTALSDASIGKYLSISRRTAEPGMADELVAELKRIFAELTLNPGFLGCSVSQNQSLPEEVQGLAFWSDVASYMDSLPLKALYEVRLFHRIQ